jgi:hypothetical protein
MVCNVYVGFCRTDVVADSFAVCNIREKDRFIVVCKIREKDRFIAVCNSREKDRFIAVCNMREREREIQRFIMMAKFSSHIFLLHSFIITRFVLLRSYLINTRRQAPSLWDKPNPTITHARFRFYYISTSYHSEDLAKFEFSKDRHFIYWASSAHEKIQITCRRRLLQQKPWPWSTWGVLRNTRESRDVTNRRWSSCEDEMHKSVCTT